MFFELQTERRGYTLWIDEDIFGGFFLYRRWYGLTNRRGGSKRQLFFQKEEALRAARRVVRLRIRHGYQPITGDVTHLFASQRENAPSRGADDSLLEAQKASPPEREFAPLAP